MAFLYFDSCYCPCGFLIVKGGTSPMDDAKTTLIQSDWDFPGVAASIGWTPCDCGSTDGTIDCKACNRKTSDMISEAYDYLRERDGQSFEALDAYLSEVGAK